MIFSPLCTRQAICWQKTGVSPFPPATISGMAEDQRQDRSESPTLRAWPIAVPLVVVPAFYVLSMCPAVMLRSRGWITQETFLWFYTPVIWLYNRSGLFNLAVEWYLSFWT